MLALAVLASTALASSGAIDLRKAPPDPEVQPYRARLESVIKDRYPRLLTEKVAGTAVVTMLFDPHGDVVRTDLQVISAPVGTLTASEEQFSRFGLPSGALRYVGVAHVQLPLNTVLVVLGGMDSRELDRALIEHYFPKVLMQGASPNKAIWILFDHEGRVLRTGEEPIEPASFRKTLEARYPGIRISDMTVTPVVGRDGRTVESAAHQAVQLHCVWLEGGSPFGNAAPIN